MASITGKIVDIDGDPVRGKILYCSPVYSKTSSGKLRTPVWKEARVDDEGWYHFEPHAGPIEMWLRLEGHAGVIKGVVPTDISRTYTIPEIADTGTSEWQQVTESELSEANKKFDEVQDKLRFLGTSDIVPDDGVTAAKIADGAVTGPKIADGAVDGSKIADHSIGYKQMASDSVGTPELRKGSVSTAKIASKAVTDEKLADESVTETKIASGAVTPAKIAPKSITKDQIADRTITNSQIGWYMVGSGELMSNAVHTRTIANGQVTEEKLSSDLRSKIGSTLEIVSEKPSTMEPGKLYIQSI